MHIAIFICSFAMHLQLCYVVISNSEMVRGGRWREDAKYKDGMKHEDKENTEIS